MITFEVYMHESVCAGFQCSGHAGFAEFGQDIVCASVTSAIQLTINGLTEVLKLKAKVEVLENSILCTISKPSNEGIALLDALALHMRLLSEDYPKHIEIIILEV